MSAKPLSARSAASTRLMRSNSSVQSTSEIRRMLVMMLRTVTFMPPCRWCSSRTIWSAVVPCAARRSSSQTSAGVIRGSWSRRRCSSCTAKAAGSGRARRPAQHRARVPLAVGRRRRAAGRPRRRPRRAARPLAVELLGRAPQVLDQHDAQRDRDGPELADRQRLDALVGAARSGAASPDRSGCRCAPRRPRPGRTRADSRRTDPRRASAAGGSSRAGRSTRICRICSRRCSSCRAATRPPA